MTAAVRVQAATPGGVRAGGAAGADPLRECRCVFVIDVHPARTLAAHEAVRDELNAKLMRYDGQLGGVMLAYWQDKIVDTSARMLDIIPYVSVTVKAHVLLFKPRIGADMVGRVNMVGADHVGLLVCNAFNVSISRENIRPDLRFVETAFGGDDRARLESVRQRGHVVHVGTDVLFTVKGIHESEELLSLSGALLEEHTGSVAFLQSRGAAPADDEAAAAERQRRKQERRAARAAAAGGAVPAQDAAAGAPQDAPEATAPPGGKHKRRREEASGVEPAVAAAEAQRKHKKKHKADRDGGANANGGV